MSSLVGIIPARYASTRFPGKPLALIGGIPMVKRVYDQVCQAKGLDAVFVATDDDRIFQFCQQEGMNVLMTSEDCPTGTDRCNQALTQLKERGLNPEFLINIQGDEPFIQPEQIEQLIEVCQTQKPELATLVKVIKEAELLFSNNTAKVVLGHNGAALYFSREPIPHLRGVEKELWAEKHTFYKHIGMYAYRADILPKVAALQQGNLELAESLEQLRWLENGFQVLTAVTTFDSYGVDTPNDISLVENRFLK